MDRIGGILVSVFAASVAAIQDEGKDKPATPAEQYKALLKEFQDARDAYSNAYDAAKTDEEREKVSTQKRPPWEKFALRFLELGEKNPKDPVAVDSLVWVVSTSGTGWGKDSPPARAIVLLRRDHIKSDKLAGDVCRRVAMDFSKESETFLRTVLAKNPHRDIQGEACLALAQFLKNRLRMLDIVTDGLELAKHYENMFGKDYLEELKRQDRAKVVKEIEALFEQAAEKYGDLKGPFPQKVAQQAKRELFEIRYLAVGREAPDIEGEDQDGKPFKLSDYRGKVVLLDFWSLY